MGAELMPMALLAKLLGALALCFGLLVAAAYALRKHWPSLGKVLDSKREEKGLQILQTRGLGPGAALHLIEVDGARILVLQGKERSDVIWSRDDEKLLDQAYSPAALPQRPAQAPASPAALSPAAAQPGLSDDFESAFDPEAEATLAALAEVVGLGSKPAPTAVAEPAARPARGVPAAYAPYAETPSFAHTPQPSAAAWAPQPLQASPAAPAPAPAYSPAPAPAPLDPQSLQARHERALTLQRARQRRYRERHRSLAQAQGVLLFPGPTGTRR